MFMFKTLVAFFIIFASLVNALPTPHQRLRRSCPNKTSSGNSNDAAAAPKSTTKSSSPSKSSAKPESKSNSTTLSTGTKLLSAVFPIGVKTGSEGWTTVQGAQAALPLSDATLRPTKDLTALPHPYVSAPDGTKAMEATYAKGSWTFGSSGGSKKGGFSFYAPGPAHVDLTLAKEATFGYSVMFADNFEWNLGGKMPSHFQSTYGGDSAEVATSCSGGRRANDCWSARFMWRQKAPPSYSANKKICNIKPLSECNPTYGASVARGSYNFKVGGWNQISQRVKLNDPGQENGEIQVWSNGESVINLSGLVLRDSDKGRIWGAQMQTFFGGHTEEYASPTNTKAWFADFSMAITQNL
ncbi:polysaccharide lyase family 14 protein [Piloderma croceum F 1598]|uniref:Polysaccharide lyase family 14 protein n=1 Tax=Piloderma croceum (strain F 1598) TaxID=765440 RepID=A0A0C3FT33_PILCF|nr:polysaccharide lyase family 14 protein [Piloderma croceum F 1598]